MSSTSEFLHFHVEMYSVHNEEKSVVAERFINDFIFKKCIYYQVR